jgi:hypothetical protein
MAKVERLWVRVGLPLGYEVKHNLRAFTGYQELSDFTCLFNRLSLLRLFLFISLRFSCLSEDICQLCFFGGTLLIYLILLHLKDGRFR